MQKFLLHTCCAPCSIAIIDELKSKYNLTVFFYNPNIYPEDEYLKRKKYVVQICEEWKISMIDMDYDAEKWCKAMIGYEREPEGGERCLLCFKFRLAKTAEYAKNNDFQYFGTSLTMGRNKSADIINPIGKAFAKAHKINFYLVDWKKDGRQEKSAKLVAERGIYRQNYCGCSFSLSVTVIPTDPDDEVGGVEGSLLVKKHKHQFKRFVRALERDSSTEPVPSKVEGVGMTLYRI